MNETTSWRGQEGMVGKTAVIWLALAALIVVAGLDVVAIGRSTFRLSEIASEAASTGAANYQSEGRSETKACEAVAASVEALDPNLKLGRNACRVDGESGQVTVTLKVVADTILAGRLGPTEGFGQVVVTETAGISNV
ncbi:MAG: hypothetical protein WEE66_04835 [Actinomycetota bacterium]